MEGVRKARKAQIEGDLKTAVGLLEEAAESENGEALYSLGLAYKHGNLGLESDDTKKYNYFKRSAELGYPRGMFEFGLICSGGGGWIEKAFKSGDHCVKGCCYYYGTYVTQNQNKAFKRFLKAAEEEDACAMYWVGTCFRYGKGVEENFECAFQWFLKGANLGFYLCQFFVGYMLRLRYVERNLTQSWKWLKKSAKQGYKWGVEELKHTVFDKFELHENCRNSILYLICARKSKHSEILNDFPFDIVMVIARILWDTRNDESWNY